jgi:hypothetical protein
MNIILKNYKKYSKYAILLLILVGVLIVYLFINKCNSKSESFDATKSYNVYKITSDIIDCDTENGKCIVNGSYDKRVTLNLNNITKTEIKDIKLNDFTLMLTCKVNDAGDWFRIFDFQII